MDKEKGGCEACTVIVRIGGLGSLIPRLSVTVSEATYGVGPRFVTAEHWRLHQLFPEEMAHATQHFTDLVERQLVLANEEGLLVSSDPSRDAWYVTKMVMAVFHHYAYAEPVDPQAIGEELWQFCLRALGGAAA